MGNQKKRKWTVFFIIKSVGGSIKEAIRMINEIRSLEMRDSVSIILCMNFLRENLDAVLQGDETLVNDEIENPTPTTIFFNLIAENDIGKPFLNRLDIIGENSKFDITNPDFLEEYFRTKILARYKAKHYLLFTWDHGRAYGVFEDFEPIEGLQADGVKILHEKTRILTMEELNTAIFYAFRKRKIDVLVMMNCFVQFIDAGYALRRSLKYFVAPQTSIDFRGYNYVFIFCLLLNNPKISPKELAKAVVKSFSSKVYVNRQEGINLKKHTSIFATDLQYYSFLAKQIDKLVDTLLPMFPEVKLLIKKLKEECICIPGKNLIDFYSFITALEANGLLKTNTLSTSMVLSLKELIILESHIGESLEFPFTGLSIFFPNAMPIPTHEIDGFDDFFKTEFIQKTKWLSLIKATIN